MGGGVSRDPADADRDALLASDAPSTAVAAVLGKTPARVRQMRGEAGDRREAGRPRSEAATPRSARGAALLSVLVTDAAAVGETPEAYLEGARVRRSGAIVTRHDGAHRCDCSSCCRKDPTRAATPTEHRAPLPGALSEET